MYIILYNINIYVPLQGNFNLETFLEAGKKTELENIFNVCNGFTSYLRKTILHPIHKQTN